MTCNLCPRKCGALRTKNENIGGYCKMPQNPVVARAALHMWEEPCISGENGSGTVFFSGCSLRCVYCQNHKISKENFGKEITTKRLAEIFKELYELGAENINLVNPTHYVLAIEEAFDIYKPPIPVVYNSGGYDSMSVLKIAKTFTDVFLLDLKYLTNERAEKYSDAKDYPSVAKECIKFCANEIKENRFDERGIMQHGLIIRHLVLPSGTNEAIKVTDWVAENVPWAVFSLMSQYVPCGDLTDYKEINRRLTIREYEKVLNHAANCDIKTILTQELDSSNEQFIPSFDLLGV